MYRFVGPRQAVPRQMVRAHFTDTTFIRAVSEVPTGPILKAEVDKAANLVIDVYKSLVPRSLATGRHLADALGKRSRVFKDDNGAYVVIGAKIVGGRTIVKNFHVQEKGSTIRFRRRIGGRYAWMEKVLAEGVLKYKRQTGVVIGHHYLQRAFESQVDNMARQISYNFLNKVLYRWVNDRTRSGAVVGAGNVS